MTASLDVVVPIWYDDIWKKNTVCEIEQAKLNLM